jgi:transcriptional regulator with XRE-family HTH domain
MNESGDDRNPGAGLRLRLRGYRRAIGMTQAAVARVMDWSVSKVVRIESGAVRVSTNDLRALLACYGVRDLAVVEELVELAHQLRRGAAPARPPLDDVREGHAGYLESESTASVIRQYEPVIVPDLLQTEAYRREVMADLVPHDPARRERLVEEGIRRQQVLGRPNPPTGIFILDEAVLWRRVGAFSVMAQQRRRLVELAGRSNVRIQVVPFSGGFYPGLREPFVLLESPNRLDSLFLERAAEQMVPGPAEDVERFADQFRLLQHKLALEPNRLAATIERIHALAA